VLPKGDKSTVYAGQAGKASELAFSRLGNPPNLGPEMRPKTRQFTRHTRTNEITRIFMKTIIRGIVDSTLLCTTCNIESRPGISPESPCTPGFPGARPCGFEGRVFVHDSPESEMSESRALKAMGSEKSSRARTLATSFRLLGVRSFSSSDIKASAQRLPLVVSFRLAFNSAQPRRARKEAALNSRDQQRTLSQ
jgi:hypothetical protein